MFRLPLPICLALFACGASSLSNDAPTTGTTESEIDTVLVDAHYSDALGWNVPQKYRTIRFPDLNGDGATDVCGRGTTGITCAKDDGTGQHKSSALWTSSFSDAAGWAAPQYYSTIAYVDLNGDGKADVCGRGPTGVVCALTNASSTAFGSTTLWSSLFNDASGWNAPEYYATITFADLNGDGKADVCGRGSAGVWCALSTGTTFGTPTLWSATFGNANGWNGGAQYYGTIKLADINGDGKADICGRGVVGMQCAISTGTSFGATSTWSDEFSDLHGWTPPEYFTTIELSDVNNDGKADLCARGVDGVLCAISSGSAFAPATTWESSFSDANGWNQEPYYATIRIHRGVVCGRNALGILCAFSNSANAFTGERSISANESDANGWNQAPYYSTLALTTDLKITGRGPDGVVSSFLFTPDRISMSTMTELTDRRAALITKIWGQSTINTTQGADSDVVLAPSSIDVAPLPAGVTVRRLTINMPTAGGAPIPGGPAQVQGLADHFTPSGGSTRLVIMNPGHSCRYTSTPYQDAETVIELLAEGYSVLATYMPRNTPLDCPNGAPHNDLFDPNQNLRPASGKHPLLYFMDPVRRSLNHVLSTMTPTSISMVGLSGGGWTTTLYGALDPRIGTSIPVAGTEPFYMRAAADAEQERAPELGNDLFDFTTAQGKRIVTGYKDLYLLGAIGAGRRQIQVLNRSDDGCFGEADYIGTSPPWNEAVRAYEVEVRQKALAIGGGSGSFRVEINEASDCTMTQNCGTGGPTPHSFTKNTRVAIVLAELDGSEAALAPADATSVFGRAMSSGRLVQNNGTSTTWTDTGLAMVGTPAVVKAAVNPFDVFYRDPSNRIVHAKQTGGGVWSKTSDMSGTILSDPSAISWGAGRIDVVAIGADYKLVHWWYASSAWHMELIATPSTFAVGSLALATSGPNRLDIYFRAHDGWLFHTWSTTGASPFTTETTTKTIKSFASASSFGTTLWVYATGLDDRLYQGQKLSGGSWTWTNISGATAVLGSPSVRNGTRDVYTRLGNSGLGRYSSPTGTTTWAFTDLGQSAMLGSPTTSNTGAAAFITNASSHASSRYLSGSGFNALGGFVER